MSTKFRLEVDDGEGGKYSLSFQGNISSNQISKINDLIERTLLNNNTEDLIPDTSTTFGKVTQLIENKFPLGSFTSNDILECYEDEYTESIKLSIIATYLARLEERNHLKREKTNAGWSYRRVKITHITT